MILMRYCNSCIASEERRIAGIVAVAKKAKVNARDFLFSKYLLSTSAIRGHQFKSVCQKIRVKYAADLLILWEITIASQTALRQQW